jgi:hypothetical protein
MSALVCRKEAFTCVGLLDENLDIVHDQDWYARLLLSGASISALGGAALVRRDTGGGLVARHRDWYREERTVLERCFSRDRELAAEHRRVRAHRALLFARIGLRRRDYVFARQRLGEAFWMAPFSSIKIIARRLWRNARAAELHQEPSRDRSCQER